MSKLRRNMMMNGFNNWGMGGGLILIIAILVIFVGIYAIVRKKRVK